MTSMRILSVGQCAADHSRISRTFQEAFNVEVVGVDTTVEALEKMRRESFALVLVNRVFDADEASGLDFIKQIKSDVDLESTQVMLVSNFEDSQKEAMAAGATRGFGKAALGALQTIERIRNVLG